MRDEKKQKEEKLTHHHLQIKERMEKMDSLIEQYNQKKLKRNAKNVEQVSSLYLITYKISECYC